MATDITLTELRALARLLCAHTSAHEVTALIERFVRDHPNHARDVAVLYLELGHRSFARRALEHLRQDFVACPDDIDTLVLIQRAFALEGHDEAVAAIQQQILVLRKRASVIS